MICFGASLNAIPWLYSTEILPLRVRAQGTALAVFNNWIWVMSITTLSMLPLTLLQVFLIVMVTPTLFQNCGWKTYLIFMIFVSVNHFDSMCADLFAEFCIRSHDLFSLPRNKRVDTRED